MPHMSFLLPFLAFGNIIYYLIYCENKCAIKLFQKQNANVTPDVTAISWSCDLILPVVTPSALFFRFTVFRKQSTKLSLL